MTIRKPGINRDQILVRGHSVCEVADSLGVSQGLIRFEVQGRLRVLRAGGHGIIITGDALNEWLMSGSRPTVKVGGRAMKHKRQKSTPRRQPLANALEAYLKTINSHDGQPVAIPVKDVSWV